MIYFHGWKKRNILLIAVLIMPETSSAMEQSSSEESDTSEINFRLAPATGNINDVRSFMQKGVNINATGNNAKTSLMLAAENDQQEVVEKLTQEGVKVLL